MQECQEEQQGNSKNRQQKQSMMSKGRSESTCRPRSVGGAGLHTRLNSCRIVTGSSQCRRRRRKGAEEEEEEEDEKEEDVSLP